MIEIDLFQEHHSHTYFTKTKRVRLISFTTIFLTTLVGIVSCGHLSNQKAILGMGDMDKHIPVKKHDDKGTKIAIPQQAKDAIRVTLNNSRTEITTSEISSSDLETKTGAGICEQSVVAKGVIISGSSAIAALQVGNDVLTITNKNHDSIHKNAGVRLISFTPKQLVVSDKICGLSLEL